MSREEFSKYAAERRPWFSFYEELVERFNTREQARFYIEHMGASFAEYEAAHAAYNAHMADDLLPSVFTLIPLLQPRRALPRRLPGVLVFQRHADERVTVDEFPDEMASYEACSACH